MISIGFYFGIEGEANSYLNCLIPRYP